MTKCEFHIWKYVEEYSKTWNLHICEICGKHRTVNKKHDGNKGDSEK